MAFPEKEVTQLLAACHRRCCICHRFCGVKMETDHMVPRSEQGSDDISNAIPVCFECHAEIHLYNDAHPKGRKFKPDELRIHKEQWLEICRTSAQYLASVPPAINVGPVQALVDELEFNRVILGIEARDLGAPLEEAQFNRCIAEGAVALMQDDVKQAIFTAYAAVKTANAFSATMGRFSPGSSPWAEAQNRAVQTREATRVPLEAALAALREHLGRER